MSAGRVLFLQYTDPAAYPPLDHAALLLARAGWDVLFVGIRAHGTDELSLTEHARISERCIGGRSGGPGGALKYATFAARALLLARQFRPDWCYASDALSAPAALLIRRATGARLVYHEHDAPAGPYGRAMRVVLRARARLAATADLVVVPSEARRDLLPPGTRRNAKVVWNCPLRDEVAPPAARSAEAVRLVYAGSLSADRVPTTIVEALAQLPAHVELHVFGYPTIGHSGQLTALREYAARLGVADRVHERGTASHGLLIRELAACDIGLAVVRAAADANLRSLVHASNKAFDYMAAGLPFLVTDSEEWRSAYVDPGYALACQPDAAMSIADSVRRLLDASLRQEMGARAQQRIRDDWNYETVFAPVLAAMAE